MTNNALAEKFLLVSKLEKNLTEKTIKAYRCDLKAFNEFLGSLRIQESNIDNLREYLAHLEQSHLKDSTVRRKLATLKVFYGFLEEEGLIALSPARKLKKKYIVTRRLPKVMSKEEIQRLLQATYKAIIDQKIESEYRTFKLFRDRAILELLFSTGMRIDELSKLNLQDIDFSRRTVLIRGKGRKERIIYLSSDEVIHIVKEYIQYGPANQNSTPALFLNKFGDRLSVHSIGKIFDNYRTEAGIERKFTPHCLRHTMATMLLENGADVRSVQEILGHSQISTTEIYLSVSKHRKQEVLTRFNQRNNLCFSS
ncbi:MAG TPA: tyrosine-type recombinase/integrase [bacterium]|nr:tyrosine-type recombinase/integrase [bacterium]